MFSQRFTKEDHDVELKAKMDAERDGMLANIVGRVPSLLSMSALPEGGRESLPLMKRMSVRLDPVGYFLDKCAYIEPLVNDARYGKTAAICCFKADVLWCYREFMKDCGMEHLAGDERWLNVLYDHYNVISKQPRKLNLKRARIPIGIDLTPAWRVRLIKKCGRRSSIPSES
jgi:hypothetical protein